MSYPALTESQIANRCDCCLYPYDPIVWSGLIGEDLVALCADCHHNVTTSGALTDPWVRCLVTARRHMDIFFGDVLITEREV